MRRDIRRLHATAKSPGPAGIPRRKNAVDRPVVGVGRRAAIAEDDQLAAAPQRSWMASAVVAICSASSPATCARSFASSSDLDPNRRRHFAYDIVRLLLFLAEKWIEETGVAHVVAQFAMLEEHVHRLPQRVIEDLHHLLMHERIPRRRPERVRALVPGSANVIAPRVARRSQRLLHFRIALGRPEAHHHVFGRKMASSHGRKSMRKIERRQRALPDDHRMHEFHRDVLRVGGIRTSPKRQQPPAAQKPVRHLLGRPAPARRASRAKKSSKPGCVPASRSSNLAAPDRRSSASAS